MPTRGRRHRVWKDREGMPVVELHQIPGMAHGTPLATSGVDGSGVAGPFLLDVGVSSSLEIARFWGLTGVESAGADRTASAPAATRPDGARRARPGPAASHVSPELPNGVADVIAAALRKAGLLK